MPIPAFDDPRSFLDDFAVSATIRASGGRGAAVEVRGIFDENYIDARLGDFDMATSSATRLKCMAVDVVSLRKHDLVAIEGVTYYLDHDPKPDGHGYAVMALSRDTGEA